MHAFRTRFFFEKEQEGPGPYRGVILKGKKKLQSPIVKEGKIKRTTTKQTNWREGEERRKLQSS
jgi:hypothetical protein